MGTLIDSIRDREVCSSASGTVGLILRTLGQESDNDIISIRPVWDSNVIKSLCSEDYKARSNAADYLLPEILKFDPSCGPYLLGKIRTEVNGQHTNGSMWAMLSISLHARLTGLPVRSIDDSSPDCLWSGELCMACVSADDDIRLAGLTILTASNKTSDPINSNEINFLKSYLKFSLKSPESDRRQRVIRVLKSLVVRLIESSRIAKKNITSLTKKRNIDKKNNITTDDILLSEAEKLIKDSEATIVWLREELINNMYPNTSFDREIMTLDIFKSLIEIDLPGSDKLMTLFLKSKKLVFTLLNMFVSR